MPNGYNTDCIITKTYQYGNYVFQGTIDPRPIIDSTIGSWSAPVSGRCQHSFYLTPDQVPAVPVAPFLAMVKFFNSQVITDMGSNFPTFVLFGNTVYNNNTAESFISASIEPYMGKITILKKFYA